MKLLSPDAIRRCFIADPGMSIFSVDYDQIELRVIAALANEPAMIKAAKEGVSLHLLAANRLFGIDHTPDQYKLSKNINFTYAFAGGAETMARRYEITFAQGVELIRDYEKAFPTLAKYKRNKTEEIIRNALSAGEYNAYKALRSRMFNFRRDTPEGREARAAIQIELKRLCYGKYARITTHFGRKIIVDAEKPYAAINYEVQTTAADIMKRGFLRIMDDEELEPTLLLLIHDEALGQGPKNKAQYLADRYAKIMTTKFLGVPITASGKVYGKSWGHGYRKNN